MFVCEERMASRDGARVFWNQATKETVGTIATWKRSDVALQERSLPRPELVERTWKHDKARFCRPPSGKTYAVVRYRTLPCPPRPSKVVANERTFCEPWATPVTFYQHNIRYP
jgi:hypothetical protein